MITERITDPKKLSRDDIGLILENGSTVTVQFSKPEYPPGLIKSLNSLCKTFGNLITARFYGHYQGDFDASVLSLLPDVKCLAVDCLRRISNEDQLARLCQLERLDFGVFEFDRPDFLDGLVLEQITHLTISENKKRNLDLFPLNRCEKLKELYVQGHTKNIGVLSQLLKLEGLRLSSMPKRQNLSFIGDISKLKSLELLLGGRQSIDELCHAHLEELRIVRIRGLETLGSLDRFPSLRRLQIEDQFQIRTVSVSGPSLFDIKLFNCNNLSQISGLDEQGELKQFRAGTTQLDLNELLEFNWPPSVDIVALYSGNEKWNKAARKKLDQSGFREFS